MVKELTPEQIKKWTNRGITQKDRMPTYEKLETIAKEKGIIAHFGNEAKEKYKEEKNNNSSFIALAFFIPEGIYILEPEENNEEWNPAELYYVVAHELSHAIIDKRQNLEYKGLDKLYFDQDHSKAFWETFLNGNNSLLSFTKSKLEQTEVNGLDDFTRVEPKTKPSSNNNGIARWVYFPDAKNETEGKIRRKQYFNTEDEAKGAWTKIWQEVLKFADESMNNPPSEAKEKWNSDEKEKRWVQINVRQKNEDGVLGKYKVYIYHNNENKEFAWFDSKENKQITIPAESVNSIPDDLKKNLEKSYTRGWEIEGITSNKSKRLVAKFPQHVCGYSAQIQVPPKGNN